MVSILPERQSRAVRATVRYSGAMPVHVVTHPIVQDALTTLRRTATDAAEFRRQAARLTTALAVEATRALPTRDATVDTPLGQAAAQLVDGEIVVVPVLRAGLSMLDAILDLLPSARVGYVRLQRDEQTAVASTYYTKLPEQIAGARVLLVDPMLATGGSAVAALDLLSDAGVRDTQLLCIVATTEGVAAVDAAHPRTAIYTASVDPTLNGQKFIVPGLGDFGDRLYGTD